MGIVANDFLSWAVERLRLPRSPRRVVFGRTEILRSAPAPLPRGLLARGLAPGDVVGVEGQRSFGVIASMLGVLRSGGVLLTLDRRPPGTTSEVDAIGRRARWVVRVGPATMEDSDAEPSEALSRSFQSMRTAGSSPGRGPPRACPFLGCPRTTRPTFSSPPVRAACPRPCSGLTKGCRTSSDGSGSTFGVGPGDRCSSAHRPLLRRRPERRLSSADERSEPAPSRPARRDRVGPDRVVARARGDHDPPHRAVGGAVLVGGSGWRRAPRASSAWLSSRESH